MGRKFEADEAIVFTKGGNVYMNFVKPVGSILLKKTHEMMEIIKKDEVSRDI